MNHLYTIKHENCLLWEMGEEWRGQEGGGRGRDKDEGRMKYLIISVCSFCYRTHSMCVLCISNIIISSMISYYWNREILLNSYIISRKIMQYMRLCLLKIQHSGFTMKSVALSRW